MDSNQFVFYHHNERMVPENISEYINSPTVYLSKKRIYAVDEYWLRNAIGEICPLIKEWTVRRLYKC